MDRARSRRLLSIAFAISLLIHLVWARFVQPPGAERNETEITSRVRTLRIVRVPKAVPSPRPTPKPTPVPQPHTTAVPRPATRPAHVPQSTSPGAGPSRRAAVGPVVATGKPASLPTPVQTAAPTATPCAGRSIPPQVLQVPTPPPIPSDARRDAKEGVAAVNVSIDENGRVTDANVRNSTGSAGLDAIATEMARNATYSPATADCKNVAGTATFTVQFWVI